jgi:hypothetical protein
MGHGFGRAFFLLSLDSVDGLDGLSCGTGKAFNAEDAEYAEGIFSMEHGFGGGAGKSKSLASTVGMPTLCEERKGWGTLVHAVSSRFGNRVHVLPAFFLRSTFQSCRIER